MFGPLREMFKDFSEEEQLRLIEHLKLLSSKLDQALSQHGSERAE
jgi:hypothetical protein